MKKLAILLLMGSITKVNLVRIEDTDKTLMMLAETNNSNSTNRTQMSYAMIRAY